MSLMFPPCRYLALSTVSALFSVSVLAQAGAPTGLAGTAAPYGGASPYGSLPSQYGDAGYGGASWITPSSDARGVGSHAHGTSRPPAGGLSTVETFFLFQNLIDQPLSTVGGGTIGRDSQGRMIRIGDAEVTYDRSGRAVSVAGHDIAYDSRGRVVRFGGELVRREMSGRPVMVGPERIGYDTRGDVTFLGSARVDRDLSGRISRVGDKRVAYDSNGRWTEYGGIHLYYRH